MAGLLSGQTADAVRARCAELFDPARRELATTWLRAFGRGLGDDLLAEHDAGGERQRHAVEAMTVLADAMAAILPAYLERLEAAGTLGTTAQVRALEAMLRAASEDQRELLRARVQELAAAILLRDFPREALVRGAAGAPRRKTSAFAGRPSNGMPESAATREYQLAVGRAVAGLDLGADATVDDCVAALGADDPCVRLLAIEELTSRGGLPAAQRERVFAMLGSGEPHCLVVRDDEGECASTWLSIGSAVRLAAARLLRKTAPNDPRLVDALLPILEGGDAAEKRQALLELGMLGSAARPRLRFVLRAMRDPDPGVAREAVVALSMIGLPPAEEIRSRAEWRALLRSTDAASRRRAVEALAWSGPGEADALDLLRQLARHRDAPLAASARATLERLAERN